MDAFPRKIIGWSMGKRQDTALVANALAMTGTRRRPESNSTILHSDQGRSIRHGHSGNGSATLGCSALWERSVIVYDNAMMESFWHTMQQELLDTRTWNSREELAAAIFEWIECWYNPYRRHSRLGMLSPAEHERCHQEPPDPAG
jgi:putative transposase